MFSIIFLFSLKNLTKSKVNKESFLVNENQVDLLKYIFFIHFRYRENNNTYWIPFNPKLPGLI